MDLFAVAPLRVVLTASRAGVDVRHAGPYASSARAGGRS
jgi:hypothetical protein